MLNFLNSEDFNAIGAENGSIGVELAKSNLPDLIICDILMPEMDGYDVLFHLEQNPDTSLNDQLFLAFLEEKIDFYQIPPQKLCFEITETVAIANLSQAGKFIEKMKKLGCSIALDDFGSGMSSFGYLKSLPCDYLKIDGNFVKDIVNDPIDEAMVDCINRMAQVIGIKTIAEYVENEAIIDKLKTLGVDYAQGYRIAMPEPLF